MGRYFARKFFSTASILALASAATSASAYEVKRTNDGNAVRWADGAVTLHMTPSVEQLPGGRDVISKVFSAWSGQQGAPSMGASIDGSGAEPSYDHNNSVFFMPHGYDPAGKALAITILTYDNKSGQILDADIVVNGKYTFGWLPNTATQATAAVGSGDIYDIEHVLAHESGHALGLSDELERSDVLMFRYSSPNDASMRLPTGDDKAGLSEIYSKAIVAQQDNSGCGDSSISPNHPNKSASGFALAFGVGFVTFMVLRRKNRAGRAGVAGAASLATFALTLLPTMERASHARGIDMAEADSHATASVVKSESRFERGMIRTHATLRVDQCRVAACPDLVEHESYGGTVGNITQVFGHDEAPKTDERVHLSFEHPTSIWEKMKPGFVPANAEPGRVTALHSARTR